MQATLASSFMHASVHPDTLQISPSTAYVLDAAAWVDSGHGLAGVTFYSGAGAKLSSAGMKIAATIGGSVSRGVFPAPPGAYFAAIWAGNWAGGGQLQVVSACLLTAEAANPSVLLQPQCTA